MTRLRTSRRRRRPLEPRGWAGCSIRRIHPLLLCNLSSLLPRTTPTSTPTLNNTPTTTRTTRPGTTTMPTRLTAAVDAASATAKRTTNQPASEQRHHFFSSLYASRSRLVLVLSLLAYTTQTIGSFYNPSLTLHFPCSITALRFPICDLWMVSTQIGGNRSGRICSSSNILKRANYGK